MAQEEEKKFASGICFYKLFWVFLIASIFGAYYEQIVNVIYHLYWDHKWVWALRRGVIYGPISPVYGAGAVLFTIVLLKKEHKDFSIFLRGALTGGILEYVTSFLQETFLGTVSWDYSQEFLNINGRTTIPYMMVWGLLALFFARVVYPVLSKWVESFPRKVGSIVTKVFLILLILDFIISWGALFRQMFRVRGYEPVTFVGEFFDTHYNDEKLKKYYSNMRIVEEKK